MIPTSQDSGLCPPSSICVLTRVPHQVTELLQLENLIDLVIPRGGKSLVAHVKANTRVPVLSHADGICHVYVDSVCVVLCMFVCVRAVCTC